MFEKYDVTTEGPPHGSGGEYEVQASILSLSPNYLSLALSLSLKATVLPSGGLRMDQRRSPGPPRHLQRPDSLHEHQRFNRYRNSIRGVL